MVKYSCNLCSYETHNKTNFARHRSSNKHKQKVESLINETPENASTKITQKTCEICGKFLSRPDSQKRHMTSCLKKYRKKMTKKNEENFEPESDSNGSTDSHRARNPRHNTTKPQICTKRSTLKKSKKSHRGLICNFCGLLFSRLDSLTRHQKSCGMKQMTALRGEVKIEKYKTELKYKDKQIHKYKQEVAYFKNLLNMSGGITSKAVSSTSHIVNNHDSAPPLEKLRMKDLQKILNIEELPLNLNGEGFIDKVISAHNSGTAGQFLGDLIINMYKKEDPDEQSIWATDTSRQTYLIKKPGTNADETSRWVVDKKGRQTIKYIIDPIVKKVSNLTDEYHQKHVPDVSDPEVNVRELDQEHIMFVNENCMKLKKDIKDKKLHKDILKYISGHFYYEKSKKH